MITCRGDLWFILASGPSLTRDDCHAVRDWIREHGRGVSVAINSTVFDNLWVDMCYASDPGWWRKYTEHLNELKYNGERVSIAPVSRYGVKTIGSKRAAGLGQHDVHIGPIGQRNSGLQAVNVACIGGAKTVVLLGHDGKLGPKGERHHHPDHPHPLGNAGSVDSWSAGYTRVLHAMEKRGIRAVNCTRRTAHTWPRMDLHEFLKQEAQRV